MEATVNGEEGNWGKGEWVRGKNAGAFCLLLFAVDCLLSAIRYCLDSMNDSEWPLAVQPSFE
jgi:hypothetical protein